MKEMKLQIVVLDRGGLGELPKNGPTENTQLDDVGTVTAPLRAMAMAMAMNYIGGPDGYWDVTSNGYGYGDGDGDGDGYGYGDGYGDGDGDGDGD